MEALRILVKNMETKNELRIKHKKLRSEINREQREALSTEICSHILGSSLYQQAGMIYAYYPLEQEVSLLPLIRDALIHRKKIAFPKVHENEMDFYTVESLDEFKEGHFHVMEPFTDNRVVPGSDTLVLTPGVVFDMDGNRIGYGKGYYDRYLRRYSDLAAMGVAYEAQVEETFEAESGDVKMDYLVTELGIRKIGE